MRPSCRCSSMALTTRPNSHPTNFILSKSTASFPWCLSLAVKFNEVDYELSRWAAKMGQTKKKNFRHFANLCTGPQRQLDVTTKNLNSAPLTPEKTDTPCYPFHPD